MRILMDRAPLGGGVESDMSGSVNKVILVGNLGRDPEVRRLNSGDQVVNIRIATSENWRDKATGERKEKTEWHNVVIFNERHRQDRRAILQEGHQGLSRRPVADAQMDRPVRRREIYDRSRAAAFPRRTDAAGFAQRRRRRELRRRRRAFSRLELRPLLAGRAPPGAGERRRRRRARHRRRIPF